MPCVPVRELFARNGLKLRVKTPLGAGTMVTEPPYLLPVPLLPVSQPASSMLTTTSSISTEAPVRRCQKFIENLLTRAKMNQCRKHKNKKDEERRNKRGSLEASLLFLCNTKKDWKNR